MTTQIIALTFKDLTDFSAGNRNETIPPSRAVQATLDAYKTKEATDCEIYKSWTTSLFQRYGPTKIGDSDLTQLFNAFSLAIEELLNECQECINKEKHEKLIAFLNYSMELFTWIRSVAADLGTNEITAFLCFGLSVINSYLVALSKIIDWYVNELVEKSLALQTLLLGILSENLGKLCFDEDSESLLSNLISRLCAVGELSPKLDIKTSVDTWRSITKLASQNVAHAQSENNSFEDIVWLKRPMSFLISEIGRNVQTVYNESSLSESIHQIEKYLKVTNFYLRLLQKLTMDFRCVPFPVCEDFLNTLALVLTPPAYIINTPVHKAVMEYITKDLRELIPFAYRNDLFLELLLNESGNMNSNEAFYEILLEMMELAVRRNEPECLNPQLLDAALQQSSKCAQIFVSTSTYHRFVETISSLHIQFHLEQLKKTLINNILQDDIVLALTAIDIWCTIFSVSNHSTRKSYFDFWRGINERFPKFSNQLPVLYIEVLLKKLYTLFTAQEKVEIWNDFNARALNHDRFLLTIGLDSIPESSAKQSITQYFVNELARFLKESSNDMTVDSYYTIVKDLKLLTPIAFQNDELIEMLLRYLEIAMKNKKLTLLVESILDFITPKLKLIDDSRTLEILTGVSKELSTFEDHSAKLCLTRFLKRISKNPRLEKHAEEILKIVESDKLIKYFGNIEEITNEKVNLEKNEFLLQSIVKNRSVEKFKRDHVCSIDEEMHVKKRMKMDIKVLLESVENTVDKVQSIAKLEQLSPSNMETIKRVVSKLQRIGDFS